MNDLFTLDLGVDIYETSIDLLDSIHYNETIKCVEDMITYLLECEKMELDYINEAVVSGKTQDKAMGRTRENIADAAKAYDDITTGYGDFLYYNYKVAIRGTQLLSKVVSFIFKVLSWLPRFLVACMDKIKAIGTDIMNKLKDRIAIYITIDDLAMFEKNILPQFIEFFRIAKQFTAGDKWNAGKFFTPSRDFVIHKDMNAIYKKLKLIKFERTNIELKDNVIRRIYFSAESNYYKQLMSITKSFSEHTKTIDEIQKNLKQKIEESQVNKTFFDLSDGERKKVRECVDMINGMINLIATFYKYASEDVKAISNVLKRFGTPTEEIEKKK